MCAYIQKNFALSHLILFAAAAAAVGQCSGASAQDHTQKEEEEG